MIEDMTPNDGNPAPPAWRGAVSEALPVPGVTHVGLPVVTADEAFGALRDACAAAAAGRAQIKLFLDGILVSDSRHPVLPQEHEDRDSYFARVGDGPTFRHLLRLHPNAQPAALRPEPGAAR
jgi:hypothetical protein